MRLVTQAPFIEFDGNWAEFRKWLDGTYANLPYAWVDDGPTYSVLAVDNGVQRLCSFIKEVAEDFEANFKRQAPTRAPVAADGKPFFLPNIFPGEVLLNFTGCSDALSPPERFGGALFGLQKTGAGSAEAVIDFLDGVFLAGGHIEWTGGSWGSSVYMELLAPASTTKAPASPGTGNCNKVSTGLGFNIIVPAAGDGEFDIDAPVPVPANDDETNAPNGYWNYSEPWLGKGVVSACPGTGKYNLFDAELELAHFAKLHLFRDTGWRDLIASSIKPKWILPEWKMKVIITNAGTGEFSVGWDLLIARRKSV